MKIEFTKMKFRYALAILAVFFYTNIVNAQTVTDAWANIGRNPYFMTIDASNNIYVTSFSTNTISKITPNGTVNPAWATVGAGPAGIVIDATGNLYTVNRTAKTISKITPSSDGSSGTVTQFASLGGNEAYTISIDASGNLYAPFVSTNKIAKITSAGSANLSWVTFGDGSKPFSVIFDASGNLYSANASNSTVHKINSSGTILTTWTLATGSNFQLMTFDAAGNLYITCDGTSTVSKITPSGTATAAWATLTGKPAGIVSDADGNIFTANGNTSTISKISPDGTVTHTFASLVAGASPFNLIKDASGNLYSTNLGNNTLSKISYLPSVSITSSATGAICAGANVTFTANAQNFTNPYYQWYANGTPISGATSSTYSSTSLVNGDQVNVKVNEGPFGGAVTSNGLLLNLDATNPSSYPGSGTTWNNLVTGNEVTNFTIQSGGTYSTDNGGVIRFGNSTIGAGASSSTGFSNLSAYTVEVWVKPAGTMGDYDPSVEGNTNYTPSFFAEKVYNSGAGNRVNMVLAYNARGLTSGTANNSYRYEAAINNGSWKKHQIATNYSSDLNNWVQIVSTYDGSKLTIYRNGVSLGASAALGITSLRTPSIGYWIAHRWDMNDGVYGDYSKVMMYDKALTSAEVSANYNAFNARFVDNSVSSLTITTTVNASPSVPAITVTGDGCINKTTLSTPTGQSAYAWYKDNVAISNTNSSTYTPTTVGDYKVQVTSGSCTNTSTATTIYTCAKTPEGKMLPITASTTMVATSGEINSKYGVDERGLILTNSVTPVTTGLMLYLDATRSASYGGSGTTWNDISGELPAGSATLVGNPPFASGSFTFGSNMNASTSKTYTISNQLTLISWVNPSQIQSAFTGVIFRRTSSDGGGTGMFLSNNNLHYDWDNQDWSWRSGLMVPNDQWSMIVISVKETELTAYLCNASGISSVIRGKGHSSLTSKGATNFHIGLDPYPGRQFKGKMGTAMAYSVGLSTEDITTIFNAQKSSFGL